jgi:hypothetical protein
MIEGIRSIPPSIPVAEQGGIEISPFSFRFSSLSQHRWIIRNPQAEAIAMMPTRRTQWKVQPV